MAFAGPGKGSYVLVDEVTAEAGILDLDGPGWEKLWKDYQSRFPRRPTLIMSMRTHAFGDALVIPKPVKLDALLATLEKLRASCRHRGEVPMSPPQQPADLPHGAGASKPLQETSSVLPDSAAPQRFTLGAAEAMEKRTAHEYCGDAPNRDVTDPIQLEKIYYDPGRYLQGHLQRALAKTQAANGVCIKSGWGEITLLPEASQAMLRLSDKQLRPLCVVPLVEANVEINILNPQEVEKQCVQIPGSAPWQLLQPLLWKVALWTSRGRIPVGIPLDSPVHLKHWPNVTRLLLTPHAMRIAALWTAQPHSLLETVTTLQIPQRYVFAFFSAAYSVGLVELKQTPIRKSTSSNLRPRQKGILGRILSRLRRVSQSR
ncbi:hypothetical protein [Nitrosococcus wardiae]|nr:hypothetical protein [Nitrosococcus wardiae]